MKNINNFQALQKNELSKVKGGSNNKFWTWAGY
ncbi:MAG: ComC/BlpC family leader-containing pheromone/bacteriocin, partial [Lactiplantibacillus plantarum]|nr:ComC/BlpC family leader-containing pheromone/bacteriocin [Lactiplantibacillus plantarum]